MTLAVILISLLALAFLCTVVKQDATIKFLKAEVEHHKEVAAKTQEIFDGFHAKMKKAEGEYELVQVEYYTSDSDVLKYPTIAKMDKAVRSKLALLVGNDLAKKFKPETKLLPNGSTKYSLILKVKKLS